MATGQKRWVSREKRSPPSPDVGRNPLDLLKERLWTTLNSRFGIVIAALLIAPIVVWYSWDKLEKLPGIHWMIARLEELRPLPKANGDLFSVAIVGLDNDDKEAHERVLIDALERQESIQLLVIPRTITLGQSGKPQEEVREGHARARELLKQCNADVMIWGTVFDEKVDSPISLHWTTAENIHLKKTVDSYRPSEATFDLPELFWSQLGDVLGLLVTTQQAGFESQGGHYIANKMKPLIGRVRSLLTSEKLSNDQKAPLLVILGKALTTYGEQQGNSVVLTEAIAAYRSALQELTREKVPLDWAMTQNNLGTALETLGERESGTAHLDEAVAAYRSALQEYTREKVPLDWAGTTQRNLAGAQHLLDQRRDVKRASTNAP